MPELTLLARIMDEPLAIAIFFALIILKGLEALNRYLKEKKGKNTINYPEKCIGHENKLSNIENLLQKDMLDRDIRQKQLDKKLKSITLKACIAVLYSPSAPTLEKFHTVIEYLKNHGNGNGQEHIIKLIMEDKQNKQIWKSALNDDMKINGACEDRYFREAIKNIAEAIR